MPDAAALLDHLEHALGRWDGEGVAEPEWGGAFSILRFDDVPHAGVTLLVTFGISQHVLRSSDGGEHRQELLVALRQTEAALDLAASVGDYVHDSHIALLEGETVAIPAELRTALDRMVVATPEHVAPKLAEHASGDGPVRFVWLLPFAADESHVVLEHGWRDLYEWLRSGGADPFDLERSSLVGNRQT